MIVTDKMLYANEFAEYYSGKCFLHCDTFEETRKCLAYEGIYIKKGYLFSQIDKLDSNLSYAVVQFSSEEDYTQYEYIIMRIQKKYLKRFMRNMSNDCDTENTDAAAKE